MHKINLRELYPDMYKTDTFLEVTDEVQAVFLSDKRAEAVNFVATSPSARGKKSTFTGNEAHSRGHEVHREQRGF
ncbi:hypothetical protein ACTNBZ_10675, partial [Pseudoflavonifractor sp. HCP28S3_F10]